MSRATVSAVVVAAITLGVIAAGTPVLAQRPSLAGRWTLNRAASQFPTDVGFGGDLIGGGGGDPSTGGGGLNPASATFRESEDDVKRREQLVEEVRTPPVHLTITQTDTAVTIAADNGTPPRTFHPDGREDTQLLNQVPVTTIARWVGASLEVRYRIEQNRELRCTYSRKPEPSQLVVGVQFVERGSRETIVRVYEPARANEPRESPDKPATPSRPAPAGRPASPPPSAATPPPGRLVDSGLLKPQVPTPPPQGAGSAPVTVRGPDAELRGLTKLGVVVEELTPQAAACGVNRAAIEAAVSKSLADAGLAVSRNGDEDSYFYVQIITSSAPGLCVSRYDTSVFTHATTTLTYQAAPIIARVLLLQKGGLAGGTPATHGASVAKSVKEYTDELAARIRNANR